MLKRILLAALLLPLLAFGQTYPSPTYQNVTVLGTLAVTGAPTFTAPVPIASGGTGQTTASAAAHAFNLGTTDTPTFFGVTINGSTAHGVTIGQGNGIPFTWTGAGSAGQPLLSGGASADPAYGNLSVGAGGTGRTTLTAHSVLLGNGTGGVNSVGPCATTGQSIIGQGASADPVCGYPTGTFIGIRVFASSGTYTATAGTNSIIVELCAGGGAGGGAPATGVGQLSGGAGGSAGGYIKHRMTSGFSGATITIGSGGVGASGAGGGAGGNTVFGALTANGGSGGIVLGPGTTFNANNSSNAGTASGGNILNINGALGSAAFGNVSLIAGIGAASPLGSGGYPTFTGGGTAGAASGYCSGGGGSALSASQSAVTGGAGAQGVVIVWEFN